MTDRHGRSFVRPSQRPVHVTQQQMMVLEAGQGVYLNGSQLEELIAHAPEWVGIAHEPAPEKGADTYRVHIRDFRNHPEYLAAKGLAPKEEFRG